jgi:myo-inositol 2-dehydrogenase / D-chiro-inositol 1-dehydrogenase
MEAEAAAGAAGRRGQPVPPDWKVRFGQAYRDELQQWVKGAREGVISGPGSYDGYAATAVAEACTRSLQTGERAVVLSR